MRLSFKLASLCATAAILPLLIASILITSAVSTIGRHRATEELQRNARAASAVYEKRAAEMRSAVSQIADEVATRAVVSSANPAQESGAAWARLQDLLPRAQNEYYLDFVVITDPAGRVIARHNDRPAGNESVLGADYNNPIAQKAVS
ncbi:MAG TPA: hypothetical protein VJQ56_02475, partial [Blastocatellia bacterium]|nr:hypothetical protein [Blastocatellia bacterium]